VVHAVASGTAPAGLVPLLYEVADHRDLPEVARGEDGRMGWRLRARHRLREPERRADRASDEETLGLLRGCRSARDRLIVLLMGLTLPTDHAVQKGPTTQRHRDAGHDSVTR
jgi:integrase/recombinase XerD